MPLSLHAAYVPSALQMLGTAKHLVDTAEKWCDDHGHNHADIVGARIVDDMLPFSYQIKSVAEHTKGSIEGLRAGVYSPDLSPPPANLGDLRTKLAQATEFMNGLTEEDMEAFIGQPMRFEFKSNRMDFTAEDFLLSFSQPNFYFHCATAYDILRMKGVPVGKRDFLGRVRIKP